MEEFANMDPQVILGYIEGEPEISSVPVEPGMTNSPHIRGISTEDRVPYEQVVFYDIRFYVRNPKVDENVGIVIVFSIFLGTRIQIQMEYTFLIWL